MPSRHGLYSLLRLMELQSYLPCQCVYDLVSAVSGSVRKGHSECFQALIR